MAEKIDTTVNEAYERFVRGLFMKLPPRQLRAFVTGFEEPRGRRREAA